MINKNLTLNSLAYGISQNPDTKNYILVVGYENYCEKCGKEYINLKIKLCKSCKFSENKNVESLESLGNEILWIPYGQFSNIEEIGEGGFATIYSARWKDGPLHYEYTDRYLRQSNQMVALKLLHNSQDISNEFLSEV